MQIRGPVETTSKKGSFDRLVTWGQLLASVVAVIGVPAVYMQLRQGRSNARGERTARLVERYSDREFHSVASRVLSFLTVESVPECVTKLQRYQQRKDADEECLPRSAASPRGRKASINDVYAVFAFLEIFASAYNRGDLARNVAEETFPVPPVQLYSVGWWFVCWRRRGQWAGPPTAWWRRRLPWLPGRWRKRKPEPGETDLFGQLDWMVKALRRKLDEVGKEFEKTTPGRLVLCEPPQRDVASDPQWKRARRCATLLSERADRLDGVVKLLEAELTDSSPAAPSDAKHRWLVVVVPETIDRDRSQAKADLARGEKLAELLARLDQDAWERALDGKPRRTS